MNARAARMADALAALGRVRVDLSRLLAAWASAAPDLAGRLESRDELADTLSALAAASVIVLPSKASWDRARQPPLPKFVTVPAARRPAADPVWRKMVWHPELSWVSSLAKLAPSHLTDLEAVNKWLTAGGGASEWVPLRVRSAEIFGDEKRLDELLPTSLFGTERLSLELLAARRLSPPLAVSRVGPGPDVLVVENSDPFWVCCQETRKLRGRIGRVGFGCGNSFPATVASLAGPEPPGLVYYWGDLDPDGVRIASLAAEVAARAGLTVLAAGPLWEALTALEPTEPGAHRWTDWGKEWFGPDLWTLTEDVRNAGGRVAQERLNPPRIATALEQLEID
jgi:hypothetical protein